MIYCHFIQLFFFVDFLLKTLLASNLIFVLDLVPDAQPRSESEFVQLPILDPNGFGSYTCHKIINYGENRVASK